MSGSPSAQPMPIEEAMALAAALYREGRLEEALALYGPLQAARPTDPTANAQLGSVLAQLGRAGEAVAFLAQAARLAPGDLEILNNLALALGASGQAEQAADAWRQLGGLLRMRGRPEEAVEVYETALSACPGHVGAGADLGATLLALGRHAEAVERMKALLADSPEAAAAHNNLGNVQLGAGDVEAAIVSYRRAVALRLDYFEAYSNLGLALAERRPDEARDGGDPTLSVRACYEKALELRPDFPPAHWNLGLCLLLNGDYAQGWKEYEWRWKWSGFGEERRPFAQPAWRGEPPPAVGGALLVTAEQGLGDTLQFARYLPLLVERGFDVVFEVQTPVFTLLWHSLGRHGVRVVPRAETPARVHDDLPFARHVPLMSLPERFETRLETIPDKIPYLFAEPTRKTLWAGRLAAAAGSRRKIGLAWKGRSLHARDRERSVPAAALAPLLATPDVRFFAVHKHEDGAGDTPAGVIPLDGMLHDFSETAAVVANLDLVITVDSSIAHLAGAMGAPVWVMLPFSPDWRWLLGRDDSPWYPTATLFRQSRAGDWAGVAAEIARRLSAAGEPWSAGAGVGAAQ